MKEYYGYDNIPDSVFEKVISGYSNDVARRLLFLLQLRDRLKVKGVKIDNRLLRTHYANVRKEFEAQT